MTASTSYTYDGDYPLSSEHPLIRERASNMKESIHDNRQEHQLGGKKQ